MSVDGEQAVRAVPLPAGVTSVPVAVAGRPYEVLIGTGLLAGAAELIVSRLGPEQVRHRHRQERRRAPPCPAGRRAQVARQTRRHRYPSSRRGNQELRGAGIAVRAHPRDRIGARRRGDRARRRRDRRSRGLCRQHRAPRRALRAGADDIAGTSGLLGRRQDRHQHTAGQEPDRHLPSAEPGAGRHRPARHPAARASFVQATWKPPSTACSATQASSPGSSRTGARCSRTMRRHSPRSSSTSVRGKADDRRARRDGDRRPHAARTSATRSATRSRPGPATRSGCCTARPWQSASASPSSLCREQGLIGRRRSRPRRGAPRRRRPADAHRRHPRRRAARTRTRSSGSWARTRRCVTAS